MRGPFGLMWTLALFAIDCAGGGTLPPLSAAARAGDLTTMQRLLAGGADPNERDTRVTGWPPLLHALHTGQRDAARLLLARGADPNVVAGDSALTMAVRDRDREAVDLLLAAGADPNRATARGYTPLMMAASHADPAILEQLLAAGADPRVEGPDGTTALTEAVAGGAIGPLNGPSIGACHTATVATLLRYAPDLKLADTHAARAALRWAHFHAQLQRARNIAAHTTTGRPPVAECGRVLEMLERR